MGHVWFDLTDELVQFKLLKKVMLLLIERYQNTQCITVCCVTGLHSCPWWLRSIPKSAKNGHMGIRKWPQMNGKHRPGLINQVAFWGKHGTRMHGRKATSGKFDNHVNVTLTCTTNLTIVLNHVLSFMEMVVPHGCGLLQQDNAPCYKAKLVLVWFEQHNELRCWLVLQIPEISIQSSIWGMCWTNN